MNDQTIQDAETLQNLLDEALADLEALEEVASEDQDEDWALMVEGCEDAVAYYEDQISALT